MVHAQVTDEGDSLQVWTANKRWSSSSGMGWKL